MTSKITIKICASIIFVAMVFASKSAYTLDTKINANVQAEAAISATKGKDMNFGNVSYESSNSGEIQLGTDGRVKLSSNSSGLSLNGGSPTAGDLTVSGDGNTTIQISCESNAYISTNSSRKLNIKNLQFSIDKGKSYGYATPCKGLSLATATVDLASNATPKIFFGGSLNFSNKQKKSEETSQETKVATNSLTVRVVYQ